MPKCSQSFVVRNHSVKRFNIHCEYQFGLGRKLELVENFERMIGVFDVGWQALDKRSHLFVEKTRYQFSGATAGRNYWTSRIVSFVNLGRK